MLPGPWSLQCWWYGRWGPITRSLHTCQGPAESPWTASTLPLDPCPLLHCQGSWDYGPWHGDTFSIFSPSYWWHLFFFPTYKSNIEKCKEKLIIILVVIFIWFSFNSLASDYMVYICTVEITIFNFYLISYHCFWCILAPLFHKYSLIYLKTLG